MVESNWAKLYRNTAIRICYSASDVMRGAGEAIQAGLQNAKWCSVPSRWDTRLFAKLARQMVRILIVEASGYVTNHIYADEFPGVLHRFVSHGVVPA